MSTITEGHVDMRVTRADESTPPQTTVMTCSGNIAQIGLYLYEVIQEIGRQYKVHPIGGDSDIHNISILTEEVGEAAQAANDAWYALRDTPSMLGAVRKSKEHTAHLREELIQISAYAIRAVQEIDEREAR